MTDFVQDAVRAEMGRIVGDAASITVAIPGMVEVEAHMLGTACVYIYIYIYTCVYIYIYVHICTYTHIHTYRPI